MKIPLFEEIQLNDSCSEKYIEEKFKELSIGEVPLIIRAEKINSEKLLITLPLIQSVLEKMDISPLIPYPIVIITKHIKEYRNFIVVDDEKKLPKFFHFKMKKFGKKENDALGKISNLKNKFANVFNEDSLASLKESLEKNKVLKETTAELFFYEELKKSIDKIE